MTIRPPLREARGSSPDPYEIEAQMLEMPAAARRALARALDDRSAMPASFPKAEFRIRGFPAEDAANDDGPRAEIRTAETMPAPPFDVEANVVETPCDPEIRTVETPAETFTPVRGSWIVHGSKTTR